MSRRKPAQSSRGKISVGDRVYYGTPGFAPFLLQVIEDRGNIGWQGRHILRVRRISEYPEERVEFEVPAEDVKLTDETFTKGRKSAKNGRRAAHRINVGDRVFWETPHGGFEAEVTEDRGHIGVGGRRLVQIRTFDQYEEARLDLAVPEEELRLLD